jgi:hypothetical protein
LVYFFLFWYFVRRKIWQPWSRRLYLIHLNAWTESACYVCMYMRRSGAGLPNGIFAGLPNGLFAYQNF